ncbi:MAG: arylsulfatase A-like enzyme [Psychromonas sp.]
MKNFKILVLILPLLVVHCSYALAHNPVTTPVNIVIIMSDDQGGWDYSFMGNKVLDTPNIDAMVERSARLSRFYVSPLCIPSRASLMSGLFNYRTRVIEIYLSGKSP